MLSKPKGLYQIHALIGRCHLHNKKKCLYSITLKMGSKAVAHTEYKMPTNDEINYNTELILKIDKALFEGPGKLSMIVTMLTEQKEKKIIGSAFANFKQKGSQSFRVSQCSCKDKGFEVNVEFEVVNIQNHNNNPHNNKFQSPNNSQMKDLKKTLAISRQKQLVKSSRAKQSTATKSPVQKTESKLNKQKISRQLKDELSPDLSSLTTRITPHSVKLNEQTKQLVSELRDKISELEAKLRQGSFIEKSTRKQTVLLQKEIDILRSENGCLIEILKFEEQKSSAAISYIEYLTQKIGQNHLMNHEFHQFYDLIQTIKKNDQSDTHSAIKQHNSSNIQKANPEFSFQQFKPIQEKQEHIEENTDSMIHEIQQYKVLIVDLRQKIIELEEDQVEKSDSIAFLEQQVTKMAKENNSLNTQIEKLQKSINDYQFQLKSLHIQNTALDNKAKQLEKLLSQMNLKEKKSMNQIQELSKLHNVSIKENASLKQKIILLQGQIHQNQKNYQQVKNENERLKMAQQKPKTPFQSQIILKKSRFDDGQEIQNIINELNCFTKPLSPKDKQLMLASRRADQQPQFQTDHFLSRNKSESLLQDLQQTPGSSQQPKSSQTSQNFYKASYQNNDQATTKSSKKVSIPQHKKQVSKYNYEYDIDSLNYFNNFEENHEIMETSGVEEGGSGEIEVEVQGKV